MNRIDDQFLGGQFSWFTGVVEDINDPEQLNRARVRCFGYHTEDLGKIKTTDLPWATVMMPTTSASVSGIGINHGLKPGSWVIGFFRDGPSAQDPVVMGSIASMYDKLPTETKGFRDPSGYYPYKQQDSTYNDTNFRARGIAEDPARTPDAIIAEPESPYAAVYPNNQVIETEGGHVIELDDTPEASRIRIKHSSGTFVEMHPNGDIVTAHANGWRVVTGNDALHVTGNMTVFVDGDAEVNVGGNSVTNITGTADITVGKNTTVNCPTTNWTGNINLAGNINITGTSTASVDHVSAGISGKNHVHTEQGDGADVSKPK